MRNFGLEFYPPIAWVPLSQERENVLATKMLVQLVQIGSEGHRVGSPQPKKFTSRFFGKLRKVVLPPIDLPEAVAEMSGTAEVDGMYDHALPQGRIDGTVEVWVRGTGSVVRIDAACDHQYFPSLVGGRPFLNEVDESQVRAGGDPGLAERKPDRFCCQSVVFGRLLFRLHRPVAQVSDTDLRGGRLLKHESAEILQLCTQCRIRAIVNENPKLQADSIVLNWRPVGDPHSLVIHINQDIIAICEVGERPSALPRSQ